MISTEWNLMSEQQPEEGREIYISSIFDSEIKVGVFYINDGDDGNKYPQVLHSKSTPTSIEQVEYWSYSIKELKK